MNISIATLRTFVTVANAGNIIDAAHSLGRSPSAISMTLKQLEEHLGRPLFEGDRKSQLTALGNYVLQRAQREVDHYVKTIRSIENYARSEIGQIFIASVPSFSTLILPEVVGRFLGRFPNIGLDISDMESHSVARAVDEGAAEIGIASVMDDRRSWRLIPLVADPLGLVCDREHPLARKKGPVAWEDIAQFPFIENGLCELITEPEMDRILARSNMIARNMASLISLVSRGLGVTILPKMSIEAQKSKIRFLPIEGVKLKRVLSIITRTHSSPSPAVEAFIDTLQTIAREHAWDRTLKGAG